ncbi:TetR/AcrR family transcriptional regulator [Aestuariibacter sp. GS-14]|uniref:TetR/AcrR family transcriptional regulator n=1 Tax=Alteromonadaceae TaxID=72275 RepID=UPI00112AF707|nr:TetR/AcrR family transcriptional regulator [Aestuariibacter sp. GS-14]MBR9794159.1 TetR/AcrR family transcriptional regulator [Gammaproteobacteria bacterium]TPV55745.1 TetR/AcrR family transcriptional regulator [Aestuariibacter sp. GS-14]
MTAAPKNYLKEPKQNRSKASLERLLNAACELLTENGYKDFTLQEVSKRAKVSIGSIYNRFKSKEDLIRLLQVRELETLEVETAMVITRIRRKQLKLRLLVPEVITEYANLLKTHKGILRPLMEISAVDEVVASYGKTHAAQNIADFIQLLLERKEEISQPDPARAVDHIFKVVYAALARYLGLGIMDGVSGEGDWEELLDDLSQITLHYLLGHPDNLKE